MSPRDVASQVGEALKRGVPAPADDAPQEKVTKQEANYRDSEEPGKSCGTCGHFDGHSNCEKVGGRISADMVSDIYKPKKGKSDGAEAGPATAELPKADSGVGY